MAPQVLRIVRQEHQPFQVGTFAMARAEPASLERLLTSWPGIEFFTNIPPESFWTGAAIEFAARHSVAFGGMGDVRRAIGIPNVRSYENPEFSFVERGLRQHTQVRQLARVHDRLYLVKRDGLGDVLLVLLNEYDLTADRIRTARDRYGIFAAILATNPNSKISSLAYQAAESMGARIYKWGELLGALNRP